MDAQDKTTVSEGGLVVEHIDKTGRRLVIIRGDIRVLGEQESHGHDHSDQILARIVDLEARLNSLTSSQ